MPIKYKIAILMAGRILHYADHYKNIMENIVQEHDADFFLSHSPELDEDIVGFQNLYQPKILNNDPKIIKHINEKYQHVNKHNCIQMYFNRQRVFNDFKEYSLTHNIKYDLVINYRVDTYSYDKINYDMFTSFNLQNHIYIPSGKDYSPIGVCDQMAFGNIDVMEKYMSIYNDIDKYLGVNNCRITGEELVHCCLKLNNINIVRFSHNHEILR